MLQRRKVTPECALPAAVVHRHTLSQVGNVRPFVYTDADDTDFQRMSKEDRP